MLKYLHTLTPYNSVNIIIPSYRWEHRDSKKSGNFPKASECPKWLIKDWRQAELLATGQGGITEQTGFHTVGCKRFMGHENYSEVKDSIKKQYRLENIRVPLMFYEWCTCAHEWVCVCVCVRGCKVKLVSNCALWFKKNACKACLDKLMNEMEWKGLSIGKSRFFHPEIDH